MEKRTVLIVDDEPDIVDSLKFRLELEQIACLTTDNGADALRIVEEQRPDLILLDVMMPQMNGYTVARTLRSDGRHQQLPIIMLTARAQEKDTYLGLASGATEYITKPFDLDELTAIVRRHLGMKD